MESEAYYDVEFSMKLSGYLLDADYITEEGHAIIRLWCRDEDGVFVVLDPDFEPYFYVIPEDGIEPDDLMQVKATRYQEVIRPERVEWVERRDYGEPVRALRVTTEHPQHVPSLREAMSDYGDVREADVLYAVRYTIDKGLRPMDGVTVEGEPTDLDYAPRAIMAKQVEHRRMEEYPDVRVLAFDCEMASHGSMPSPEDDPILIISAAYDDQVEVLTSRGETDKELIEEFIGLIKQVDPDVIVGYNQDSFDWPYLRERAKLHDITLDIGRDLSTISLSSHGGQNNVRITGRLDVDLYSVVARDLRTDVKVKKLENVAEYLDVMNTGERTNVPAGDILSYWRDESLRPRLLEYARDDVESTMGIARRLLPLQYELSRMTRRYLDDASQMGRGRQVEAYLAAEAHHIGELVPSRGGEGGSYAGGFVLEPERGLHEDVVLLDFTSMYPSIMIEYNISPDTVVEGPCEDCHTSPESDISFKKTPDGFFKRILTDLVGARANIKRRMDEAPESERQLLDIRQQSLKILTNAFYGYTGWPAARWYRREAAIATAEWGRHFIKESISRAEEMGLNVIYGDTDSLFVVSPLGDVLQKSQEFAEAITRELPLELEIEDRFQVIFFTEKKKRYAGLTEDDKVIIKGLEVRRGDWCDLAKDIQEEVIRLILRERDPDAAATLVKDTVEDLRDGQVPIPSLVIYKTLTKKIASYESRQAHVRAASRARDLGLPVSVGSKIGYVILRGSGSIGDRAYPIDMFDRWEDGALYREERKYEIDSDYYTENQVIPAAIRILSYFGYTENSLKGEPTQGTLSQYFD